MARARVVVGTARSLAICASQAPAPAPRSATSAADNPRVVFCKRASTSARDVGAGAAARAGEVIAINPAAHTSASAQRCPAAIFTGREYNGAGPTLVVPIIAPPSNPSGGLYEEPRWSSGLGHRDRHRLDRDA